MEKPLTCSGRESRQPVPSGTQFEPPKRELGGERRFRPCLPGTQVSKFGPEISQRKGELAAPVLPDRERLVRFLVPVDDDEGDLLDLAVPDPLADGVVGVVALAPHPLELPRQFPRPLAVPLADGQDPPLDRREPEGE